jgi:hypothetical protein
MSAAYTVRDHLIPAPLISWLIVSGRNLLVGQHGPMHGRPLLRLEQLLISRYILAR